MPPQLVWSSFTDIYLMVVMTVMTMVMMVAMVMMTIMATVMVDAGDNGEVLCIYSSIKPTKR